MTTQRTFTAEEAQKKYTSLPEEIKDMLYSAELNAIIQKVGEKNKLHFDQMGRLEMETTNVLLGFTDMQDYVPILMKGLEIDEAKGNAIEQDMNEMLFSKIRNSMQVATPEQGATVMEEPAKSVVMPSALVSTSAAPVTSAQATPLSTDMQIDAPASAKAATPVPQMHEADIMLSEPTVSLPPVAKPSVPPATKIEPAPAYKADPYREPIE